MAWAKRRNKTYYYHNVRHGDRVISHYLGAGPEVNQFLQDQQRRHQAEQQRRRDLEALDAELDQLYTLFQNLHDAGLLLAGYHTHKGQWRKRRRQPLADE
jgi:hypothetical protein